MYEVPVKLPGALEVCCVVARYIIEGPRGEVILLGRRSNMELCKLFSCGNRLLRHDIQLGINLSRDLLAGVS